MAIKTSIDWNSELPDLCSFVYYQRDLGIVHYFLCMMNRPDLVSGINCQKIKSFCNQVHKLDFEIDLCQLEARFVLIGVLK